MFNNWAGDSENTKYLTWQAHKDVNETKSILNAWIKQYKNKDYYQWAIVLKDTKKLVGNIGVVEYDDSIRCCTIGYVLSKECWNQGIMTEALTAVINHLFQNDLFNRIQSYHDYENPASGKVMIKSGMKFEGILRQADKNITNNPCDKVMYSILKSDWQKSII